MEIKFNLYQECDERCLGLQKFGQFSRDLSRGLASQNISVYVSDSATKIIFSKLVRNSQVYTVFQMLPEILNELEYMTSHLEVCLGLHETVYNTAEFELMLYQKRFEMLDIRRFDFYKIYIRNSLGGFKFAQAMYKFILAIRRRIFK